MAPVGDAVMRVTQWSLGALLKGTSPWGAEQGPDWPPGGPLQTWRCGNSSPKQAFRAADWEDPESWWACKAGRQGVRASGRLGVRKLLV